MQKLFWTCITILIVSVPIIYSQDTTEVETSTIGPVNISHSPIWHFVEGPGGSIIIAQFNPEEISETNPIPEDAAIVQMQLIGLNRVAGLPGEEQTAENLLGGLLLGGAVLEPDDLPEITLFDGENYSFARADISNPQLVSFAYTTILSDATFAAITFSTNSSVENLETIEPDLISMLDTITLEFETPIPETSMYDSLIKGQTDQGFPALGDPQAPVTIMEISSFDCPACRSFHDNLLPELLPFVEAGDLYFVYVPIYGTGSIPKGDSAARAALCIVGDDFWQYHDMLFSWQDFGGLAFLYERLQGAANEFGITDEEFDTCYSSEQLNETLTNARRVTFEALGEAWRTPTIIINGTVLENLGYTTLIDAIDTALENQP